MLCPKMACKITWIYFNYVGGFQICSLCVDVSVLDFNILGTYILNFKGLSFCYIELCLGVQIFSVFLYLF